MATEPGNLKEIIEEYFKDYFAIISFFQNGHILSMRGTRNNNVFDYVFADLDAQVMYDDGLLFHYLENIKGDMVRSEQIILLEHQKIVINLI